MLRGQRSDQVSAIDLALGDDGAIDQDDWNAKVVEAVQLVVGVDIGELGVDAELLE